MPSSRAVLADIIKHNLDPKVAHSIRKSHLQIPETVKHTEKKEVAKKVVDEFITVSAIQIDKNAIVEDSNSNVPNNVDLSTEGAVDVSAPIEQVSSESDDSVVKVEEQPQQPFYRKRSRKLLMLET